MGIPKFFRWLTRRYPLILHNLQKEEECPPIDNLYLDLNGIVHNCIHGNDPSKHEKVSKMQDFDQVWVSIMRAIDEVVHIVKPQKLLFLAVDGVAPRAKMNQQRARRFRSAKDAFESREQLRREGKEAPELFDTNAISPGTQFMFELCRQLHFFAKYKTSTDPLYQSLSQVIVSDGSVPGEGEHKMMDFIRQAKLQPGYDPNTRHCFYGADADLIMLSLLTHEPHFIIIREEHIIKKKKEAGIQRSEKKKQVNFQLIFINLLREYFELEYKDLSPKMKIKFDLERIIDDFVFFCFFIGNDFLPSLSALDISEGSLDQLIKLYRKLLPQMTDYITEAGTIYWERAEPFIKMLGQHERQSFEERVRQIKKQGRGRGGGGARGYENDYEDFGFVDESDEDKGSDESDDGPIVKRGPRANHKRKVRDEGQREIKNVPINREQEIKRLIKAKLLEKKRLKLKSLQKAEGKAAQYKKFALIKKFQEDSDSIDFIQQLKLNEKYQKLLWKQKQERVANQVKGEREAQAQEDREEIKECQEDQDDKGDWEDNDDDEETEQDRNEFKFDRDLKISEVVDQIELGYLSDLRVDEILTDDVSDVDESQIDLKKLDELILQQQLTQNRQQTSQDLIGQYMNMNMEFMKKFVKLYNIDAKSAKAMYYLEKVDFDLQTQEGENQKAKMIKKYLEGLQWVLYYYYRGAQHWRWYYPYHYAPMISDIDENIVLNYFSGNKVISEFEIDHNCSAVNEPYHPFSQLLCILPAKSVALLPPQYSQIILGELRKYFPDDFEIDLNGKALPWEAVCLIPFADEKLFIQLESQLLSAHSLSDHEVQRNTVKFEFIGYQYDRQLKSQQGIQNLLESPLKTLKPVKSYLRETKFVEYGDVGKHSFTPFLHQDIHIPSPGFPSFTYLKVERLEFDRVHIQQVGFNRALVVIPQSPFDETEEALEQFMQRFRYRKNTKVFSGFPFQVESLPQRCEDHATVYEIFEDIYNPNYQLKIKQYPQDIDSSRFTRIIERQEEKLKKQGIFVEGTLTLIAVQTVDGTVFDKSSKQIHKTYSDSSMIPLQMLMIERHPSHNFEVDKRCSNLAASFSIGKEVICQNMTLFGVMGKVAEVDMNKQAVKVEFDLSLEQLKFHDPFLGHSSLKLKDSSLKGPLKKYYNEHQIEEMLGLKPGVVNRITSSFLIAYRDQGKDDRSVIDVGLNLKNFTRRQYIPHYVRYTVLDEEEFQAKRRSQQNQLYDSNQYSGAGEKPRRSFWEFSEECVNILRQYYEQYPEIFGVVYDANQSERSTTNVGDAFPRWSQQRAVSHLKEIAKWIVSLPISKLSFVEMGYDTLNQDLIDRVTSQQHYLREQNKSIQLKCKRFEFISASQLFQETYPLSTSYFSEKDINDFKIGDRVSNINSQLREYVPFGLRGTVVGHTNDKVIVLFDEQFLNGDDINGACEDFKGAQIDPNNLLNLTAKFLSIYKKNKNLIRIFQEEPLSSSKIEKLIKDMKEASQSKVQNQWQSSNQFAMGTGRGRGRGDRREIRTHSADESNLGSKTFKQRQQSQNDEDDSYYEDEEQKSSEKSQSHRRVMQVGYQEVSQDEKSKPKMTSSRVASESAKEERKVEKVKGPSKREIYEKKICAQTATIKGTYQLNK